MSSRSRRRSRQRVGPSIAGRRAGRVAAALLLLAVAGGLWSLLRRPVRADAGTLVAQSAAAMRSGDVSRARRLANRAVAADPRLAAAHLAAARAALAEGDGLSAEAEIGRAVDAGAARERTRAMFAHARLLQNDVPGALAAARDASAPETSYARRIEARALAATGDIAGARSVWSRAIDADPRDAVLWTDVARFCLSVGDIGRAAIAAERAVALDANSVDALIVRARLARVQSGPAAALPWQQRALARDPASYGALIDRAATLGDLGRAGEMLATTRQALAVRPGDPQAFYLLATLAVRAGKRDLARALFDRVGNGFDRTPGALLLGATLEIDGGNFEQAVSRLRNLVGLQPMNVPARQLLAVALARVGSTSDALAVLRPIALRDDADSYTLILAARAFERIGNRVDAARLLDRAATLAPGPSRQFAAEDSVAVTAAGARIGDPATVVPLLRALLDGRDTANAVTVADRLTRAAPTLPGAWVAQGDALTLAGRPGDAADAYRRAASLRLDAPTLLRLSGSDDHISRTLAASPRDLTGWRLVAMRGIARRDPVQAIAPLERLRSATQGGDAAVLAALGFAYDAVGRIEDALAAGAAAYRLAPASAAACDAYGWALLRLGDRARARQLLEKAAAIAPDNAQVRWHLAQVRT